MLTSTWLEGGNRFQASLSASVALLAAATCQGAAVLTSWVPLFKGVEHAVGTNAPGDGGLPHLQVAQIVRVDLADPDIRLFSTPPLDGAVAGSAETAGDTVSGFLVTNGLQIAINANYYTHDPDLDPVAGTPMNVGGLSICQGTIVSSPDDASNAAALLFTRDNRPTVIHTNWPPASTVGVYTAVSGLYPLVVNGVNVGYDYLEVPRTIHGRNPRTAMGISQDQRYLFLLTIDGRQPDYSEGAYDYETGAWLLMAGAHDGVNMDGGGSTTLVRQDTSGAPVRLNKPSYVAQYGRERTVGSHFGVYAKPLPGFINDVTARPDDTTAWISWTTLAPATSQVQYGTTPDMRLATPVALAEVTNHAVLLQGLSPATLHYFRALSAADGAGFASSNFVFVTTNHVATKRLFDLDQTWDYTVANLDGVPWTSPSYEPESWTGSGPGLLWLDTRATGPLAEVQPRNTPLPADPENYGFPYITYYFRTHFTFTNSLSGVSLLCSNYLDDGAVFYLNGTEVQRTYMDAPPAEIHNRTLATGYPCDGNAVCPVVFSIRGDSVTNLVAGDNVLAVEVHNYDRRSPDITFGMALFANQSLARQPLLRIQSSPGVVTLGWEGSDFILQAAKDVTGPWTDLPGPVASGPHTTAPSAGTCFFRLRAGP